MEASLNNGLLIYKRLVRYALKYWRWLLLSISGLVAGAVTEPIFAGMMKPLMDGAFMDKDPEIIEIMPLIILLIFLVRGVSTFVSGYFMSKVGRSVVRDIRSDLFDQLMHVPVRYYDNNPSGQLLAKLTYHVEQVASASTDGLTILVRDTLTIIGLLGLMFYQSWQLTLGLLLIVPVIALTIQYVSKRFRSLSRNLQQSVGDITQLADETISGQREVRIFNGESYEKQRFEVANDRNLRMYMKNVVTDKISTPIIQFMLAIALSLIIFIATQQSVLESLTPGRFTSFIMALIMLLTPIRHLTSINATLQRGIAAGESIFDLLDEEREKDTGTRELERCRGDIRLDHVNFSYNGDAARALSAVSLHIRPGEKYALVGKSGSGKTTLANLLPRFYDYDSGQISLDDIPIPDLKLSSLRRQFAYVSQNVTLFNDTVKHNIAYGNRQHTATDEQVTAAARAAHALEFIEKLPQGFDTLIGDDGVLLSGGQRQRLAIARAILADAPVLILDEATSALDTESERHIQAALESLMQDRTTLMIAHRLSTIEKADRIIVMDDGRIIESGNHHELLELGGAYRKLYDMQFHDA